MPTVGVEYNDKMPGTDLKDFMSGLFSHHSEDQQEVVNLEVVEDPLPLGHRRRHVQRLFDHNYGHHRWLFE